ncbi:MAG TPA: amidase [Ktedonobacterales bacterium]|nr:amidase [Ktedonobacterales bacterium]
MTTEETRAFLRTKTTTAPLTTLSAGELAGLIARGEVSAVEAVEAHIERIEQMNPALNAVVVKRYETAHAEARQADERRAAGEALGPLHGVPITIKECLDLEGTPSTFGLPSRTKLLATEDDVYVARMREAGAIILGKTNVAQLLFYYESDNPLYGRTKNPWNLDRTPGGSSGGQAAIIAAGGSPLGLGTDIGGSLRVPATFCGIASMKPTAGRFPDAGRYSVPIGQRAIVSQVGVLARQVSDVALGLEVINGGRNPVTEPPMPLGNPATVDVSRLRVACYTDDGTFQVAPAVRRAVQEAAELLRTAGAQVTAWTPPDVRQAAALWLGIMAADGARGFKQMLGRDKRDPRVAPFLLFAGRSRPFLALLGGPLRSMGQRGLAETLHAFGHTNTHHYWGLVEAQMEYQAQFLRALDHDAGGPFDVILCPANALPPYTHGSFYDLLTAGAYATLYNVLGYPAGVVPVTRVRPGEDVGRAASRDRMQKAARNVELGSVGLPVGVQVVARPWREHVALAVMGAIEQAAAPCPDYPGLLALAKKAT